MLCFTHRIRIEGRTPIFVVKISPPLPPPPPIYPIQLSQRLWLLPFLLSQHLQGSNAIFLFIVSFSVRYIHFSFTQYEYNHPFSFRAWPLFFFIVCLLIVQQRLRVELGLPYSRPAHYQQSYATPSSALHPELRCTQLCSISSL
jgi:hypothetical protein